MKFMTKLGSLAAEKLAAGRWRDIYRTGGDPELISEIERRMPGAVSGLQYSTERHLSPEMMALRGNKQEYATRNMGHGIADVLLSANAPGAYNTRQGHRMDAGMHGNPATEHNEFGGLGNELLRKLRREQQTGEHQGIPNVLQKAFGYTPSLKGNLVKNYKKLRG